MPSCGLSYADSMQVTGVVKTPVSFYLSAPTVLRPVDYDHDSPAVLQTCSISPQDQLSELSLTQVNLQNKVS